MPPALVPAGESCTLLAVAGGQIVRTGLIHNRNISSIRWDDDIFKIDPDKKPQILAIAKEVRSANTAYMLKFRRESSNEFHEGNTFILTHDLCKNHHFDRLVIHELAHIDDHNKVWIGKASIHGTLHFYLSNALLDAKCERACFNKGYGDYMAHELRYYASLTSRYLSNKPDMEWTVLCIITHIIRLSFLDLAVFGYYLDTMIRTLNELDEYTLLGEHLKFRNFSLASIREAIEVTSDSMPDETSRAFAQSTNKLYMKLCEYDHSLKILTYDPGAHRYYLR